MQNILNLIPVKYYAFSALFNFFTALIIFILAIANNRKSKTTRTFSIFSLLVAIWSLFYFLWLSTVNKSLANYYLRTCMIPIFFTPALFYQFVGYFLDLKHKKSLLYGNYVVGFLFALTVYTPLYANNPKPFFTIPFWMNPGPIFHFAIFHFSLVTVYTWYLLYKALNKSRGIFRNQLLYLFAGTLVGFIGGSTNYFGWYKIPIPPIFNILVSVYMGLIAYGILRYKLMGINIIIKKTTTYAAVIALVAGGYLAIIALSDYLFQTFIGRTSSIGRITAVIIAAIIFQPLRNKIEFYIDKIFFRGKLNYQEAIAEFTRSLVTILDLRELLNLIVSMSGILGTKQLAVFIFNEEVNQFRIKSSIGLDKVAQDIEFDSESDLIRLLKLRQKVVLKDELDRVAVENNYEIIREEMDVLKAAIVVPIFVKNELKGLLSLGEKLSGEIYSREDVNLLQTLADEAGIAIDNAKLYGDLKRTYLETVQALAQAIEASDEYTRGHSDRVTKLAIQIAKQLELGRADIDTLKFACILHDVGKIGIIKEVLNKPDKLTEAEFNIIKMHPALGEEIIAPVAFLAPIRPTVRHHHERFDGRGYPDGLKGENIPYLSRIIAVADTYDAMTSERPYRPALSTELALAEIKRCSGTQFDPEIVKAFLELDHAI